MRERLIAVALALVAIALAACAETKGPLWTPELAAQRRDAAGRSGLRHADPGISLYRRGLRSQR